MIQPYEQLIETTQNTCLDLDNKDLIKELDATWQKTVETLGQKLKKPTIQTWIQPLKLVKLENSIATLAVKNEFTKNFLVQSYSEIIQNCFKEVLGKSIAVRFFVDSTIHQQISIQTKQVTLADLPAPKKSEKEPKLSKNYNFDNYFIGKFNSAIYNFASALITDDLGSLYSSLFIIADSGLGKTHLLHALGNHYNQIKPNSKVLYISAENFTNELILAIQKNRTSEFRKKFRDLNVLLFDEFHFLDNKKVCQEEFAYTFESIIRKNGKVIIASSKDTGEFKLLNKKLKSLTGSCLKSTINQPQKLDIQKLVKFKADIFNLKIAENLLERIEKQTFDNVRELEGKLIQINALQNFQESSIDDEQITKLFDIQLNSSNHGLSVDKIIEQVAVYFGITTAELTGKKRSSEFTLARHIAIYLVHEILEISYNRIGDYFADRKHSSIIYSIKQIKSKLTSKLPSTVFLNKAINEIKQALE